MQGIAIGSILLGYCAWYTLYQRTWGDGSSYLYNLTGSKKFPGPMPTAKPTNSGTTAAQENIAIQQNHGGGVNGPPMRH